MFASQILHVYFCGAGRAYECIKMISGPVVGREGGNKCTGGDEVHTLRLILNNFLIAGAQLFHLDGNLYHSIDMVRFIAILN